MDKNRYSRFLKPESRNEIGGMLVKLNARLNPDDAGIG